MVKTLINKIKNILRTLKFLRMVYLERRRQDRKFGEQNHGDPMWHVILGEEMGEVSRAIYENNDQGVYDELVQVAAVAVAWCECRDRADEDLRGYLLYGDW